LVNSGYSDLALTQLRATTINELGRELASFATENGSYLGHALGLLSHDTAPNIPTVTIDVDAEDHTARAVYDLIEERLGQPHQEIAAALTWVASQVNYVHRVLKAVLPPDSDLSLRWRFLTAFHAVRAFRIIGTVLHGDRVSRLGNMTAELSSRAGARRLRQLSRLRDSLAHYGLPDGFVLDDDIDAMNALAVKLAWIERGELHELVDAELEALSLAFRTILAKGTLNGTPIRVLSALA
jgi:hypothetical protein